MTLERVAHGGFVVGRAEGKVLFVTGGLPGERVRVEVTERGSRFDRARVVEVLDAAPGRVDPPCAIADRCGGCDWQHADPPTQLELKRAVVAEQLLRLAGIDWDGVVEAVDGGLTEWRTRLRYAVDEGGRLGFRARRSHEVVPLPPEGCLIAAPHDAAAVATCATPGGEVVVAIGDDGTSAIGGRGRFGPDPVRQTVLGRRFDVAAQGFWQVHERAAETLTRAMLDGLEPRPGERAVDLYCGVGLFAGALIDSGCSVFGAEFGGDAVRQARLNVPDARFVAADLSKNLSALPPAADVVVLDPPRKGAGEKAVKAVAAMSPRAIAYVACDPAALARDLAYFATQGYAPTSIRAFDLFPMTHHVECVAILRASHIN
ncbi:MAG: class I SAM-dependent RNA methyltransferase [Tessaracoccus sp.]|uniref:class I SAM-dependent RNA methyltransferase n=1 Tax=Tessaracoccus sp. TaxID=1971211 RepID=UPI001EB96CA3|nr:TRAM domain-containing protein [Tessaracoccus sp.]MBK7820312.1 class I SAM-dependent RNA methyltransferase [Tessaracoccus sp.]